MNSTVTELPLHEVVLKIMFFENMEKAAPMKAEDVLWKIDNPEISERQVREVLDWLVRQRKVELYLGKYSIDRIEFLEQKQLYESSITGLEKTVKSKHKKAPNKVTPKKKEIKRNTFYLNPPKVKNYKHQVYILVLGLLALGFITYTFLGLNYTFESSNNLDQYENTIIDSIVKQKQLYVSDDELYTESAKNAISYSFARQNTINNITIKELNRLQFIVDSINKSHKKELRTLQTELETTISHSNTFIKRLVYCNVIIILLFIFFYFKKK